MTSAEGMLRTTSELLSTLAQERTIPDDLPAAEIRADQTERVRFVINRELTGTDDRTNVIFPKSNYDLATATMVPLEDRFDSPPDSFHSHSLDAVEMSQPAENCMPCNATGSVTCSDCGGRALLDCPNYCRDGIVDCQTCDGTQQKACPECTGFLAGGFGTDDGIKKCPRCSGSGECPECSGAGELHCDDCDGSGQHSCPQCDGGTIACSRCEPSSGGFLSSGGKWGVIDCDRCNGEGGWTDGSECRTCGGSGCQFCDGKGYHEDYTTCHRCGGSGTRSCPDCSGQGSTTCTACSGRGHTACQSCRGGTNPCSACRQTGSCPNSDCQNGGIRCPNCAGSAKVPCPDCRDGTEQCSRCRGRGVIDCGCDTGSVTCDRCDGDQQIVQATKAEVEYTPSRTTHLESSLGVTEDMIDVDDPASVERNVLTDGGTASPNAEWTERKTREIRSFPARKVTYDYDGEEYTVYEVNGQIFTQETPDSRLFDELSEKIDEQQTQLQDALTRRDEYVEAQLAPHRDAIIEILERRHTVSEWPIKPIAYGILVIGFILLVT